MALLGLWPGEGRGWKVERGRSPAVISKRLPNPWDSPGAYPPADNISQGTRARGTPACRTFLHRPFQQLAIWGVSPSAEHSGHFFLSGRVFTLSEPNTQLSVLRGSPSLHLHPRQFFCRNSSCSSTLWQCTAIISVLFKKYYNA